MVVRLLLTTMFQIGSHVNECKHGLYEPAACMLPTTTKVTVLPKILPNTHCSVTLALNAAYVAMHRCCCGDLSVPCVAGIAFE